MMYENILRCTILSVEMLTRLTPEEAYRRYPLPVAHGIEPDVKKKTKLNSDLSFNRNAQQQESNCISSLNHTKSLFIAGTASQTKQKDIDWSVI